MIRQAIKDADGNMNNAVTDAIITRIDTSPPTKESIRFI